MDTQNPYKSIKRTEQKCPNCGKRLRFHKVVSKYKCCSEKCQEEYRAKKKIKDDGVAGGVTTGNKGNIGELIACADLLRKGYYVYRSVCTNNPCDLVIFDGKNKMFLVEVKTVYINMAGEVKHPPAAKNIFHILAKVILAENRVVYESKIPEIKELIESW